MPHHLFSKDTGISLKRNIILVHVSADQVLAHDTVIQKSIMNINLTNT